jgi:hypothetical protein
MLSACRLSSKGCLQMCVESLLDNLKKYPMVNMDKFLYIVRLFVCLCVCVCVWEGGHYFLNIFNYMTHMASKIYELQTIPAKILFMFGSLLVSLTRIGN